MQDIKCKNCGAVLQLEDVIDIEGGISEGYIVEKQFYSCEKCGCGYIAIVNASISAEGILVDEIY